MIAKLKGTFETSSAKRSWGPHGLLPAQGHHVHPGPGPRLMPQQEIASSTWLLSEVCHGLRFSVSVSDWMSSSLQCLSPISICQSLCVSVCLCLRVCVCTRVHVSVHMRVSLPFTIFVSVSGPSFLSWLCVLTQALRPFLWPWPLTGAMILALADELLTAEAASLDVGA